MLRDREWDPRSGSNKEGIKIHKTYEAYYSGLDGDGIFSAEDIETPKISNSDMENIAASEGWY